MVSRTYEHKITRRQVDNLRTKSMRFADQQLARLRMSTLGKPAMETCECGKEYELFPNQPLKLDTAQVNALKFDVDKVFPTLSLEDLDKATYKPKSLEEQYEGFKELGTDDVWVKGFIKYQLESAINFRDMLDRLLPDGDVVSIRKSGNG